MATLTVEQIVRTGLDPTNNASGAGGDEFENDGQRTFIHVINGGGGSINVTAVSQQTVLTLPVDDLVVAVGAGLDMLIGPFPAETFNDTNNRVQLTYSGVTSVTTAVLKL